MAFSIGGAHAADFVGATLGALAPGLGFFQMTIECSFDLFPVLSGEQPMTAHVTGGRVRVRAKGAREPIDLGHLLPAANSDRTQGAQRYRVSWAFVLEVPPERLAALERFRAGQDFRIEVEVRGETTRGRDSQTYVEVWPIPVSQSEWAKLLGEMGSHDTLLVEVPVLTVEEAGDVRVAAERLREARDEFIAGRYRKVLESCRQALEALGNALGDGHGRPDDLNRALGDARDKLTKEQRLRAVRYALFVTASLATHWKDEVSIRTTWDRHEAQALLTMTAGIVQWLAEEHRP